MHFSGQIKNLQNLDITQLKEKVLSLPEEIWEQDKRRQEKFEVHYQTQSILLYFCECEHWPKLSVTQEPDWESFKTIVNPIMDSVIEQHYQPGGKVIRAVFAKLLAGSVIKPHTDAHPSFKLGHRIHIPITTNDRVRFTIDGKPHHLSVGKVYEINNQLPHSVMNKGKQDRITFIFDYVPPDKLNEIDFV